MVSILFITYEEKRKYFLKSILGEDSYIVDCNGNELEELCPLFELIVIDFSSLGWESLNVLSQIKKLNPSATVFGIGRGIKKEIIKAAKEKGLEDYIDVDEELGFFPEIIKKKVEREILISEIEEKNREKTLHPTSISEKNLLFEERSFLEEMSKFLAHGYNLKELLQFLLNFLGRMFGITRLCVLLKEREENVYKIKACKGLGEEVKKYITLYPERGIVKFLAKEGTAITRENFPKTDPKTAYEIKKEMKLIHSSTVIPLSSQGKLTGILGLGPKITGENLSPEEIKQIFLFSGYVVLAIQNLLFYEEVCWQKEYIEKVLQNASSGVITIDAKQKITTCNLRAYKILEINEKKKLLGKDIREIPSPLGDLLFETLTRGIPYERKEVYLPRIKRWLGVSTSQTKDAQGKTIGSIMIFTDLTPVKELEEEKRRAQTKDFLAQIATRLSHELRNSLVPIKSLAELLPSNYLDEDFRENFLSIVNREIKRIDELIERLLFFSQPLKLDKTAQLLPSLIKKAIKKIEKKLPSGKKVEFNITFKEENLWVYADEKAIIDAFENIIINAVEAIEEKQAKIEISCENCGNLPHFTFSEKSKKKIPPQTKYIKIEFKDNGPGFPEETSKKIFDPFFTTKNKGIGLGLTISQRIIEEHGGSIIPSNRNEGATVSVYLPCYHPPI